MGCSINNRRIKYSIDYFLIITLIIRIKKYNIINSIYIISFAKKGGYTERLFLKLENRKDITGDFYNYDDFFVIYVFLKKGMYRCCGRVVRQFIQNQLEISSWVRFLTASSFRSLVIYPLLQPWLRRG